MRAEHIHMIHSSTEPKRGMIKLFLCLKKDVQDVSIYRKKNKYGVFGDVATFLLADIKDVK